MSDFLVFNGVFAVIMLTVFSARSFTRNPKRGAIPAAFATIILWYLVKR